MSRYSICKETLLTNLKYAKQKSIPIIIILFDHSVRLYTNIVFGESTNQLIKTKLEDKCKVNDNLTYDQIMTEINNSHPLGSTDFIIPFEVLKCIEELDTTSEIFFLSDGHNGRKFSEDDLTFLSGYKQRITTLGIGSKSNYDDALMSKMSKNNETIEGQTSDIIQQEMLAQMSDSSTLGMIDTWSNVEINIIGKKSDIKVGSMMTLSDISEEEYLATEYQQNTDNPNLVMTIGENNIMISKKDVMSDIEIVMKTNMLVFIVDQSGSMADSVSSEYSGSYVQQNAQYGYLHSPGIHPSPPPLNLTSGPPPPLNLLALPPSPSTLSEEDNNVSEYVKYSMKMPKLKSFQRIIFSVNNPNFKACIKWRDSDNNNKMMILHDLTKYIPITDSNIVQALEIANIIGNYINIATISTNSDKIGYFRIINQLCKKYKKFFDDVLAHKLLQDYSLIELLFYNKKQGIMLFHSTMTSAERNMDELLGNVSAGGGYKLLAATATLSAVSGTTPSCGGGESYHTYHTDISMCSICFSEIRGYVFSCGHCYACKSCAEKQLHSEPKNKCAYCKQDIIWVRKIIMTDDQKNIDHYYKCISKECFNIATIVSKCNINDSILDDSGYHLTYCEKCFKSVKREYKKNKKTYNCFCGSEIKEIIDKIYFN
jgi:hypothetical protein